MPFFSPREIASLLEFLTDDVEVWRDPDTTSELPHANRDAFGMVVKSNAPSGAQTGRRKVAEYKCQLAQMNAAQATAGKQSTIAAQATITAPWVFSLYGDGSDEWPTVDIKKGDWLKKDGVFYTVIDPGAVATSQDVFQLVHSQRAL